MYDVHILFREWTGKDRATVKNLSEDNAATLLDACVETGQEEPFQDTGLGGFSVVIDSDEVLFAFAIEKGN